MKKKILKNKIQNQLEELYHNATINYSYQTENHYEQDLIQKMLNQQIEIAFVDIKYDCPDILKYGEVYSWGRGGRTVAPKNLIEQGVGSRFRIKNVDELELSYHEQKKLLKTLTKFNNYVKVWCDTIIDQIVSDIKEQYSEEIKENENKKHQYFSGVRYV